VQEQKDNKNNNKIGMIHLFNEINNVKGELSEVKQVLNNGIVKSTNENTEAVEELKSEINDIKDSISDENSFELGKKSIRKKIIYIISLIGSGIIGTLTILYYLGMI